MVIKPTPTFIPILPVFTPYWKVEIIHNGTTTDVTARVYRGEFIRRILRVGIGQFKLKLNNVGGIYSEMFEAGDEVKFYADLTDATTLIFHGVMDVPKETIDKGQFLMIEGRHRSYLFTETWISKEVATPTAIKTIARDIIDNNFSTFTRNNVSDNLNTTITKHWDSQKVINIYSDLCILGDADGYVDNDLDLHLFVENSIFNDKIAVTPGNLIGGVKDYGIDAYTERDKVTVVGDDGEGLPVLYTSGTGDRQSDPIYNKNITNITSAQELADAALAEIQDPPPKMKTTSYGLPTLKEGENIIASSPRQHIHGAFKVIEIKDLIGREIGAGWICECQFEKEFIGTTELIETRIRKESEIVKLQNPNNLEFSYNFTFDDDTNCNHSNTETSNGRLQLLSGQTSGTMTSNTHTASNTITQVELKIKGSDLRSSSFEVSADNGNNWTTVLKDTLYSLSNIGIYLKVRVNLEKDSENPDPSLDALAVLFK